MSKLANLPPLPWGVHPYWWMDLHYYRKLVKVGDALLKQMAVRYTSYSKEGWGKHQLLAHKTCEYQVPNKGEGYPELEPTSLNEMSISLSEIRMSSYYPSGEITGEASDDEQTCCGRVKCRSHTRTWTVIQSNMSILPWLVHSVSSWAIYISRPNKKQVQSYQLCHSNRYRVHGVLWNMVSWVKHMVTCRDISR